MNLTLDDCTLVYIHMRTVGEGGKVLQLTAKIDHGTFHSIWIHPSTRIAKLASSIKELYDPESGVFLKHLKLPDKSLTTSMGEFIQVLKLSPKPVVLVANQGTYVFMLLRQSILQVGAVDKFESVIAGFSNTLPLFREMMPHWKERSKFSWTNLMREFIETDFSGFPLQPEQSLRIFERIVTNRGMQDVIFRNRASYKDAMLGEMKFEYSESVVEDLTPLLAVVTMGTLTKFAKAKVSCFAMRRIFQVSGSRSLATFLSQKRFNGKPRVSDSPEIIRKIIQFFDAEAKSPGNRNRGKEPIYSTIDPQKKLEDRVKRAIEAERMKEQQAHQGAGPSRANSTNDEPIYAEINLFQKEEDRIHRAVDLLRNKQDPRYDTVQEASQSSGSYANRETGKLWQRRHIGHGRSDPFNARFGPIRRKPKQK